MRLVFEKSRAGRRAGRVPRPAELSTPPVPEELRRERPARLPEIPEIELVRHFTELSTRNFGIDTGFYPLGSCTMKYNPRVNERVAALPGFRDLHPHQDEDASQGALELMHDLQEMLAEITALDAVSLQPAAGSQGELTGLMLMRAFFADRGEADWRRKVVVADTAHGTNPASVTMAGYELVKVETDPRGNIDLDDLRTKVDEETAGLMLTNPSTLGLFDEHIEEIARMFHEVGGLLYYDGANLNAVCGISRPGDMGFDIVHINLHKTFSQPHGGGGPGGGPIVVREKLEPFLPVPALVKDGHKYRLDHGYHPPTIYFPLVVPEALMIEPTETEPKERLDVFVEAMLAIAGEDAESPELLKEAPTSRPVRRLDEVKAAKQAVVKYGFEEHPDLSAEPGVARQLEAQKGA